MPIQFIGNSYKGAIASRRNDVHRLLHIAFDHGFLYEAHEIEQAWEKATLGWSLLPQEDEEVWSILKKTIPPEASNTL